MSTAGFVHLHTHSEYSDFDGLSSVTRLVDAAAADGQTALAITDHGRLASLWALRTACAKSGTVAPIPGIEAYLVVSGTRHDPGTIQVAADSDDLDPGGSSASSTRAVTKTKRYEHLTILASTQAGLRNLIEMSNRSQESKAGKYPLIDYELLAEHAEGLIVLTGCVGGPIAGPLSRITGADPAADAAEAERAQANLERLIGAVGHENVYVELADHGQAAQERALTGLYEIAARNDLPVVVTNDSHYVAEDEQPVHEAHIALGQSGRTINEPDRYRFSGSGQFFRTEAQMRALRPGDEIWQRGCDETVRIAARIEADIFPETRLRVPSFPIPAWFTTGLENGSYKRYSVPSSAADGTDPVTFSYFMHRVHAGAKQRWGEDLPAEVSARLKFELSVICRLGVMDYFLLVEDLIAWARSDWTAADWVTRHDHDTEDPERARKDPIHVGPGRGSAPGSAVSYSLQIVGIDPIESGLLFERFLDLERTEMPDIDVDFEKERRGEVIDYLSVRYGHDNVCRLGMHGTNKAKRAIDSAGRYLEIPVSTVADVKKQLPTDCVDLAMLLREDPPETTGLSGKDAAALWDRYEAGQTLRDHVAVQDGDDRPSPGTRRRPRYDVSTMMEYAAVLEGVVVSPGTHPCGVVVSDENLTPLVPMRLVEGEWITEWDGADIADFGLLKMDVLGLRNLDIVKATERNVIATQGEIDFDLLELRTDGPRAEAAWELLGRGDSTGVFQLESGGMRDLLTTAHPRTLDDLAALIAAYRPGPMSAGMHTEWAERTGGKAPVSYDSLTTDPAEQAVIASVLGQSRGVILFQEQMMRLGKIVGKFDAARANNLRRAISKKKQDLIDSLKPDFIAGAQREGVAEDRQTPVPAISAQTAERLWTAFEGSGSFAFNKCVRASTQVRTTNRSWSVGEVYAKLHGTDGYGKTSCECGKAKRVTRRICTTCASWIAKFHRDEPDAPKNRGGFLVLAYDFADGRIRPKRVKDVHYNGEVEVLEFTTETGRTIGVTANHRLMRADREWVEAGALSVGDEMLMHGGFEPQRFNDYRTSKGDPEARKQYIHRHSHDAHFGRIDGGYERLSDWTAATFATATCERPGEHHGRMERAYLDGNRTNNAPSNLEWMCVSHHKTHDYRHNGRNRQWDVGHCVAVERIVSIRHLPAEPVYDLEMDDEGHNFIADGFISHNSHTAAYGALAFQTAYLKANWPAEFGAAVLRFTGSGKDKAHLRVATIRSLRAEGVTVQAPDVNASDEHTIARDGAVWLGLGEIKGVGAIAAEIVAERDRGGKFASMADVATRVIVPATDDGGKQKSVTSAQLAALAQAGAFDHVGNGYRLGHVIASRAVAKDPDIRVPQMEYSVLEKASRQRASILAITGTHPTRTLARPIADLYQADAGDDAAPKPPVGLHRLPGTDGARVNTGGVVSAFTERLTRKGTWMVTMELENAHTSIQTVGFADVHADLKELGMPDVGELVEIRGTVRIREVEREVTDEATGESSTETTLEHSIMLSNVEFMGVEDPDRDAEGDPVLAVGRMLADGSPLPIPQATSVDVAGHEPGVDPAPGQESSSGSVETGGAEPQSKTAGPVPNRARPAPTVADEDVRIEQVADTVEWRQLQEALCEVSGEGFELATPRAGRVTGTHLRLETENGPVRVPATAQRRLTELLAAGRLPALVSTPALCCVVIETRDWRGQLRAMTDAVNSGAIDPATSSVDGLGPSVDARSG